MRLNEVIMIHASPILGSNLRLETLNLSPAAPRTQYGFESFDDIIVVYVKTTRPHLF